MGLNYPLRFFLIITGESTDKYIFHMYLKKSVITDLLLITLVPGFMTQYRDIPPTEDLRKCYNKPLVVLSKL
jgi:hypothetical protein